MQKNKIMDAKDLMIGNYVYYNDKIISISPNAISEFYYLGETHSDSKLDRRDYKPIPLTEEIILKKCEGFHVLKNKYPKSLEIKTILHTHYMFNLGSFYLNIKINEPIVNLNHISLICNNNFIHHLNYVHELQNWFKLITKTDLNINL